MLKCYFDGACKGNPGPGSYGYIINENGVEIFKDVKNSDNTTNNVAEYNALILLLEQLQRMKVENVEIFGDSSLVVNQVNGKWKIKAPHLKPLAECAKHLLSSIPNCTLSWIGRDDNSAINDLIGGK